MKDICARLAENEEKERIIDLFNKIGLILHCD